MGRTERGEGMAGARCPTRVRSLARRWALSRGGSAAALVALALVALLSWSAPAFAAGTLPDGRGWELVSPAEKDGASITPLGFGIFGPLGGLVQASQDGSAVTYVADAPVESEPEGNRAAEGTQVISKRSPTSWASKDIVTPHEKGEGITAGPPQEYRAFSLDLALGLLVPFGHANRFQEPPLVPGAASEELGIYRRHSATCEAGSVGCFEPIVTPENVTGSEEGKASAFGGQLEYLKATDDLAHVVLKTPVKLTSSAPAEEEAPEGLYEWSAEKAPSEQLSYISLLPPAGARAQSKPAGEARLGNDQEGGEFQSARNAISSDGRRIFWTGIKTRGEHAVRYLFMRDTASETTLQVNASEEACEVPKSTCKEKGGIAAEEENQVHFQMANEDGSRVFFTDTVPLTTDSKLKPTKEGPNPADLYVCEVIEREGRPACKLTDLTASFSGPGEFAGELPGASEDGSTVYFVANGAPTGAQQGTCALFPTGEPPPPTSTCNLYVVHYNAGLQKWDEPKLITQLGEEDFPDWGGGSFNGQYLWNLTSRVSPRGQYFAFMSNRQLPTAENPAGYDNRDANPAAHEARDEEVFVYDSVAETVRCVSCNPNPAQRPMGVFDQKFAGEGQHLRVDPVGVWEERWLAGSIPGWTPLNVPNEPPYQARYLLDNGRVFFNSADDSAGALAAQGKPHRRIETIGGASTEVGVEDVYQYEPGGVGDCKATSCVSLLSSGTSAQESSFMDASASGDDAFLLTSQQLVSSDPDSVFDVYDARVCSAGSPCISPPAPPAAPCNGESSCRGTASAPPGFGSVSSEQALGTPNVPKLQALPSKTTVKPKPLTRAQKLARALKACRKAHKSSKKKRVSCERQARSKFGSKHSTHHKAAKK